MVQADHDDKRTRLVSAALKLVHEHGFDQTTLADIARESEVPLGNVYYYFKTKEALGEALLQRLSDIYDAARAGWDAKPDPKVRLEAFIQETIDSSESIAQSGCPVGSLCAELHKDGGPLAARAARVFDELLKWLEAQFRLIGQGARSRDHAFHLLSALQGASLLANTFHDTRALEREAKRLKSWVRAL